MQENHTERVLPRPQHFPFQEWLQILTKQFSVSCFQAAMSFYKVVKRDQESAANPTSQCHQAYKMQECVVRIAICFADSIASTILQHMIEAHFFQVRHFSLFHLRMIARL